MNQENVDISKMKQAWTAMGESLGMLPVDENPDNLDNKMTALDRLRKRYRQFCLFECLFMFITLLAFPKVPFIPDNSSSVLGIAFGSYFLIAFFMDLWLWQGLDKINPVTMPISEVARKALFYRKRHLQFMAALIPIAITLLSFTAYTLKADTFFVWGMICGALVGVAVGLRELRRFMNDYRRLSE